MLVPLWISFMLSLFLTRWSFTTSSFSFWLPKVLTLPFFGFQPFSRLNFFSQPWQSPKTNQPSSNLNSKLKELFHYPTLYFDTSCEQVVYLVACVFRSTIFCNLLKDHLVSTHNWKDSSMDNVLHSITNIKNASLATWGSQHCRYWTSSRRPHLFIHP